MMDLPSTRVIKDFMVQSGDPKGDGTGGESIWKKGFAVEPTPFLYNIRGALAMANTGAKNSNGSQFYIVQKQGRSKQATRKCWLSKTYR